jgi:hypothetical protein
MPEIVQDKDFFVSYNYRDADWAVWIAWELEENGYTTKIQAWDFLPGANFVIEMDAALRKAERVIAVLSPNYLDSKFTPSEWAGSFAKDPKGEGRKLIPVKVQEVDVDGLLGQIVYIDLVGKDEIAARFELLSKLKNLSGNNVRAKPSQRPRFPIGKPALFPGPNRGDGQITAVANERLLNTRQSELSTQLKALFSFGVIFLLLLLWLVFKSPATKSDPNVMGPSENNVPSTTTPPVSPHREVQAKPAPPLNDALLPPAAQLTPEPTLHDVDQQGNAYKIVWSIDPQCNKFNPVGPRGTKLQCGLNRAGIHIPGDNTPFDKWVFGVEAPGPISDIQCNPTGSNEPVIAPYNSTSINGNSANCTGLINGGDGDVVVTVKWKEKW